MAKKTINKSTQGKIRLGVSYGRVSTADQAFTNGVRRDDASPEAQRIRCAEYVDRKNRDASGGPKLQIIKHISDDGFSGKDTKRPGFQELWDLIEAEQISFVVAVELSRLSRSVVDFLDFIEHCQNHSVEVFIIGLQLDTSTPWGRMFLIILVALAQFEREVTSKRVKDNARARLLNDGKINGSSEILGLVRDPNRKGHFVPDPDGIARAEQIMRLFVRLPSKKKVLAECKRLGLTNKGGRPFTLHSIDILLENARWRYRGIWYVNKENQGRPDGDVPEDERFRVVELPHGPLIDPKLLDAVDEKLKATYDHKKRAGKDNYVYLLSHVLKHEDGSGFQGQPAKDRQYRYYYNSKNKLRIRCDELDPVIVKRVKSYLTDNDVFPRMVKAAIERQHAELPKLEQEIAKAKKTLAELDAADANLRASLLDPQLRSRPDFMDWLEPQVAEIKAKRERTKQELGEMERVRDDVSQKAGLSDLEKSLKEFAKSFDGLSPVQQREFVERIVKGVVVKSGNRVEIQIFGEPGGLGSRRKKSTGSEENGVTDGT